MDYYTITYYSNLVNKDTLYHGCDGEWCSIGLDYTPDCQTVLGKLMERQKTCTMNKTQPEWAKIIY